MSKNLDVWQTNMLLTGKMLGAEIPAPSKGHRAFLYVGGYSIDQIGLSIEHKRLGMRKRPSIFLNGDHSDVRCGIRVMETDEVHIGSPYEPDAFERELA
jgi:hypothetical protein